MFADQRDFVLSISVTGSPIVFSIPHEGLSSSNLDAYFEPRKHGFYGGEKHLSAIVADVNRAEPVASVVRGLLPRRLCDYNRLTHEPHKDHAVYDKRLLKYYNA